MGNYLNPDNSKFEEAVNSSVYIDKTGLIEYTNSVLHTMQDNVCVSRPRRFGKSMAANMLTAYYSRGCDSRKLFSKYKISKSSDFEKHLNQYDTIFLNMQEFLSRSRDIDGMIDRIKKIVLRDLKKEYPDIDYFDDTDLVESMQDIYGETKCPFVIIIDEWDCIFREYKTDRESQARYLDFLRDLLKDDVLCMIAGGSVPVNTEYFTNDMTTFRTEDDVLTLMIHLGYLSYDYDNKCVGIPNNEVRGEYVNAVAVSDWGEISKALKNSADTLNAIWQGRTRQVAEGIKQAHFETSHIQYHDENALSYTISLALYAARNFYTIHREPAGGMGFADLVFIPRKQFWDKPALVVELKWNKNAKGAVEQIREKGYCQCLEEYQGNLLLVGVNYDKKTREHTCVIEEFRYAD